MSISVDRENLLMRIETLECFTKSEAVLCDHLQRSYPRVVFESLSTIAIKCKVSKSTVVRFIRRLGYTSFADFQESLQREVLERIDSPIIRYSLTRNRVVGGHYNHLSSHLSTVMNNLRETLDRISSKRFDQVVELLALCRGTIYVTGQLASIGLAQVFYSHACCIRPRIQLLDNYASMMPLQILDVGQDDILLAITKRRYASGTVLAAKHFSDQKAKIVVVTDAEATPISPLADFLLVAPSGGAAMFESSCAVFAVLEALTSAMAARLENSLYKRFQLVDKLYGSFKVLIDSPFVHPMASNNIQLAENLSSRVIEEKSDDYKS